MGIGSLRADTLNMLKETGGGERDFLAAYSNWKFRWQQAVVESEFAASEGSVSLRPGGQNSLPALS